MARVKLEISEPFVYSTTLAVRIGDINYGGHLGNDAVLSLIHEARVRFLASRGLSERDLGGPGMIMSDCAIRFRSEAFQGESLRVEIALDDFRRTGFDIYYLLTEAEEGREVALARTGIVCFDYEKRKTVGVPDGLEEKLRG